MATPNVGILTNSGKNLIDQVNAGQTKITFSKIVFSSMDNSQLSDDQIKALTAITPQEVVVNSPEATLDANTGETRIRATGNNKALSDGVYVKTYAVYAKDDSGNEILYGLTVSPNPNYLPEYDGVTPQVVTYSYKVNISNTSNITFSNSDDIYVSDTDLTEALQPYAKTVDVNQQLDKKVNVADMRKPASDVAGIEEVNTKQDKISYAPADDSKVVHDNHDNTITANSLTYDLSKSGLTSLQYVDSGSFNDLPLGTVMANAPTMTDGPNKTLAFTTTTFYFSDWGGRKAQIAIADVKNLMYFRVGGNFGSATGMFRNSWTLLSDDSKVAHLSGANNFDTVPTVNNNPLLLASSLPSDLARLSHDANFTAKLQKNGQDVALVNNTIARNPDTGSVSSANTFTAAQTFSIAPVINDASKDKGDNQAATMADLKSVKASAWRQLDPSKISKSGNFEDVLFLYRIDEPNKKVYFSLIVLNYSDNNDHSLTFDLSNVISSITEMGSGNMVYYNIESDEPDAKVSFSKSGAKLLVNVPAQATTMASGYQNDCWFGYDTLLI